MSSNITNRITRIRENAASKTVLNLIDCSLFHGGAAKSEEGVNETRDTSSEIMSPGEIIPKDDASKANITLDGGDDTSIFSQLKSTEDFFEERFEEYDKKIDTLEGKVGDIERDFDGFKSNFDENVLKSPAYKNIVSRLEAVEAAATPAAGRPKRRGTNSSAKPPRSVKKPRVATSAACTPAMSTRQKKSMQEHKDRHSAPRLKEAELKRDGASYIGRSAK
jgi:hypothetical protein